MRTAPRAILFDLDGTLVDSVPDLAHGVDRMLEALGSEAAGPDSVRKWVGNGVERLVKRALTGELDAEPEPTVFEEALEIFLEHYRLANGRHSRLFPDVARTLETLHERGVALGCVTNKPEAFTHPLLDHFGLRSLFGTIVAGDTVAEKKPHPLPLWTAADELGIAREQTLFVGDSIHDVEAARRAKMPVICVSYGYNHGHDIAEAHPDQVIDNLAELIASTA